MLDLDGTDSYAKAVIIHNLLFSSNHAILLGRERPRLSLDEGRIRQLARLGKTPQVRATVRWARSLTSSSVWTPVTPCAMPSGV